MINTKQQVFDLFEKTRKEFLENCRWIAVRIAKKHNGCVNIDQVREQVTTPDGVDPRVYGSVFNSPTFKFSSGIYIPWETLDLSFKIHSLISFWVLAYLVLRFPLGMVSLPTQSFLASQ